MPIYEYKCLDCGKEFELMQKFSDEPLSKCPDCNGEIKKLISNTSFILRGSGWYVTDYANPDRKKAIEAEKGTNGKKITETAPKSNDEAKTAPSVSSETKAS